MESALPWTGPKGGQPEKSSHQRATPGAPGNHAAQSRLSKNRPPCCSTGAPLTPARLIQAPANNLQPGHTHGAKDGVPSGIARRPTARAPTHSPLSVTPHSPPRDRQQAGEPRDQKGFRCPGSSD
ncbi:hypothetical protein NDU88_009524 [Pleurodeles waltl]|uniref:Uncharacterized protein n=1 Tax=Pleurodeles waltl TaxID=8319 RepID=A0AAV7PW31_PLEWA|nr:hypothetical protein NDU88_009524 [Pleurodeles waltl]